MTNEELGNKSTYDSAEAYIDNQPGDRQAALKVLRETIKSSLPEGFAETIQYGMITYVIPHSIYPSGYHCNPKEALPFISLANQKGYIALYHMGIYADPDLLEWFISAYTALGIGKLDMGKSCIRFKKMTNIPIDLIAELCKKVSVESYIRLYEENLSNRKK